MKKELKIFYTLPYFMPIEDKDLYIQYLVFAEVAKRENLSFEMVSFQDSPGRFLTEKLIFDLLSGTDDSIFPITLLNDEIVKTRKLPSLQEFKSWFKSLEEMSFDDLLKQQREVDPPQFVSKQDLASFCSASACASCLSSCSFRHSDDGDLDYTAELPFLSKTE